ncbi:MAG: 4-hydroxythreonine-4-phosphate dehydrogenase PdxA [Arsenophonus sp.]|nr:MAG: 4-hydroxythreonine-4-phosphate dehydrogenase PdxA [Arsenophonus sp.]
MKNKNHTIVINPGEPSGIGVDILIKLVQKDWPVKLVTYADYDLLIQRSKKLKLNLELIKYSQKSQQTKYQKAGTLHIIPVSLNTPVTPGVLNKKNSTYVIKTLQYACNACKNNIFSALVTGPIHKGIINESKFFFTGHTEYLANQTNSKTVVMMLFNNNIKVAMVTTHIPIKLVSKSITREKLKNVIFVLHKELKKLFKINNPKIYVCSLNPHCGEYGYIGDEEINVIIPVIKEMKKNGLLIYGPFSSDTIFQKKYLDYADVILTMYHDQGLPILKYKNFNNLVNITLGLPFIRTSVDHGTALDIAGTNKANPKSIINALNIAIKMIKN